MIKFRYMEEIAISKFKATCLAVMERVRRTRQPVLVTRFGEPVAEIVPPSPRITGSVPHVSANARPKAS